MANDSHKVCELLTGDASTLREMIGEVPETRPDCLKTVLKEVSGLNAKNSSPP